MRCKEQKPKVLLRSPWLLAALLLALVAMSSDIEDGEIVGDVNDDYETCVQPSEPEPYAHQSGNASHAELLPAWDRVKHLKWDDNDDDLLAGTIGSGKKKPKKEKKKNKKQSAAAAAAASGQGRYLNVYGMNVSKVLFSSLLIVAVIWQLLHI